MSTPRFSGIDIGKPMSRTCKPVRAEDCQQKIASTTYYRAEQHDFNSGDAKQDWLEAEAEIDNAPQNTIKTSYLIEYFGGNDVKQT